MNLCKDCKWFVPGHHFPGHCTHERATSAPEPVHGYRKTEWAKHARRKNAVCGPDGVLFEPKPPRKPSLWQRIFG